MPKSSASNAYTNRELCRIGRPRAYRGRKLDQIAFPIGGIGTGSVSLSGQGQLVDWEILNRPAKGSVLPNSFFMICARAAGGRPDCRVMQATPPPPYTGGNWITPGNVGFGIPRDQAPGLPHLRSCCFRGEYPFAQIDFADPSFPLDVSLEAFNPLIPLNDRDSSIPVAIFLVTLRNPGRRKVEATLCADLFNAVGRAAGGGLGQNLNEFREDDALAGLMMTSAKYPPGSPSFGSMALATTWNDITVRTRWLRAGWFDSLQNFWDTFALAGRLNDDRSADPSADNQSDTGAIALHASLKPGEQVRLPVLIAWHFPNYMKNWGGGDGARPQWRNYYATQFADAWDVARYTASNLERLEAQTRRYREALFGSTLPPYVIDAVSSQVSTLKTTTCLRLEDGTFYGFEGCSGGAGCCEGSCTHVWNYQQALAWLFPALERSMRTADYRHNLQDQGKMCFRTQLPLGAPAWDFHAAGDGQMGGIIKVYRDWQISGDDAWLASIWPQVKQALEYAWVDWDPNKDGVMEGMQHNTYDIEFHGPNPLVGIFYLSALRAGEQMARYLGEADKAEEYRAVFDSGSRLLDKMLFNGEYCVQPLDLATEPKYQVGKGCLSDQMLGQWMASLCGLGHVLPEKHVKKTLQSIFRHNWRPELYDHANCQRVYALGDEKGLLLCTWPRGGRPEFPFPYCDEVWTGIEYQVASHLILEGMLDEGLSIVKGARERHDGERRNPWNEFECGSHYARAMSSWGLLLALSGFRYSGVDKAIGFAPKLSAQEFRTFWSCGTGWGSYAQRIARSGMTAELAVLYGELAIKQLCLSGGTRRGVEAALDGQPVPAALAWEGRELAVHFAEEVTVCEGQALTVKLR